MKHTVQLTNINLYVNIFAVLETFDIYKLSWYNFRETNEKGESHGK